MSQSLYPPSGPQSIGQVLDVGFRIFQRSLVRCLPHGVLAMIAGQLPNIYTLARGKQLQKFGGGDPMWIVLYIIGILASMVLLSAMLLKQRNLVSQGAPPHSGLPEAVARLPVLVALFVLVTVAFALGILALVIPGLYLMTALAVSWPAAMLDGYGPVAAMRQSMRLVKGNWWRTSVVLTMVIVIAMVFYFSVFALIMILLPLFGANDLAMLTAASVLVVITLGALGMPFYGAVLLALYGDLTARQGRA